MTKQKMHKTSGQPQKKDANTSETLPFHAEKDTRRKPVEIESFEKNSSEKESIKESIVKETNVDESPLKKGRTRSSSELQSPEQQENTQRPRHRNDEENFGRDSDDGLNNESGRRSQRGSTPLSPHDNQTDTDNSGDESDGWPQCPLRSRGQRAGQKASEEPSPSTHHHEESYYIPSAGSSGIGYDGKPKYPYELPMEDTVWLSIKRKIETIIGYTFQQPRHLRQAMFPRQDGHACVVDVDRYKTFFQQGNRKMAMMGDTMMRSVMVDAWSRWDESVEKLDDRIASIVCNGNLVRVAKKESIDVLVKEFFPPKGETKGKHVLATTVKAIIGAVWFDSLNMEEIRVLLDRLLGTKLQ